MSQPIRVFLADDHAVVREGLVALIETEEDMEVVGAAENGEEAVRRVLHFQPDVILLDLHMPRKGGLEAIVEIKEALPDARILIARPDRASDSAMIMLCMQVDIT